MHFMVSIRSTKVGVFAQAARISGAFAFNKQAKSGQMLTTFVRSVIHRSNKEVLVACDCYYLKKSLTA